MATAELSSPRPTLRIHAPSLDTGIDWVKANELLTIAIYDCDDGALWNLAMMVSPLIKAKCRSSRLVDGKPKYYRDRHYYDRLSIANITFVSEVKKARGDSEEKGFGRNHELRNCDALLRRDRRRKLQIPAKAKEAIRPLGKAATNRQMIEAWKQAGFSEKSQKEFMLAVHEYKSAEWGGEEQHECDGDEQYELSDDRIKFWRTNHQRREIYWLLDRATTAYRDVEKADSRNGVLEPLPKKKRAKKVSGLRPEFPEFVLPGDLLIDEFGFRIDPRTGKVAAGMLTVIEEDRDKQGTLTKVRVERMQYIESDTALVNRVLGREVGGKQNILVMNDEAHHAYRIRREAPDDEEAELFDDDADEFFKEATVWIDGLDRIQKLRGINLCVDLSATPYYLGRVGQETNRPFPWVVSDFGLIDAIESGLTKIPQLAVRDTTGAEIPGYFNIWQWIVPQLTSAERGGKRTNPKPEAILKYAHHPIAMLGGLWEEDRKEWRERGSSRPPVFILVCKTTQIGKVIYEWLADGQCPTGIPPAKLDGFQNQNGEINTIRVDSKVVHETDTGEAKSDESRWMRFTLDTVGKSAWPTDRQGRAVYPDGFEELANKLKRSLHPPGRDVRCIVSVGMLTEGWDCNTVTHIIGLRPFMSQLLCEQVVGRGLRRASYEVGADGKFTEEVAKIFGVPFEVIPFKANKKGPVEPPPKRHHVYAVPAKAAYEIQFPRVEGYTQAIRNRVGRRHPLT